MAVNSQQTEAHWLVSWSHEFLGSPFNYSSKLLSAKAKPGERETGRKAEMEKRVLKHNKVGCFLHLCQETRSHVFILN